MTARRSSALQIAFVGLAIHVLIVVVLFALCAGVAMGLFGSTQTALAITSTSAELADKALADLRHVDILINNAGRSIRRSLELSYDRIHDYQRTMQLNYLAAVQLILRQENGLLVGGSDPRIGGVALGF